MSPSLDQLIELWYLPRSVWYLSLYICGTINFISRHSLDANDGHMEGNAIASRTFLLVEKSHAANISGNRAFEIVGI